MKQTWIPMQMKRNLTELLATASLLLLFVQQPSHAHQFHMGITKIQLSQDKTTLEISHRYFSNDIEQRIQQIHGKKHLLENSEPAVKNYLEANFSIQSREAPLNLHWVGMDVNLDVLWIYQEIKVQQPLDVEDWKICTEVLTESYSDQMNLVTVKMPDKTFSLRFNQEKCQKLLSS